MTGYILNSKTWAKRSAFEFDTYSVTMDYQHKSNSTITVCSLPELEKNDWVIAYDYKDLAILTMQDGTELIDTSSYTLVANDSLPIIFGLCAETKQNSDNTFTLTVSQPAAMFDRNVFYDYDGLEQRDVEKLLKQCIEDNWSVEGDTNIAEFELVPETGHLAYSNSYGDITYSVNSSGHMEMNFK